MKWARFKEQLKIVSPDAKALADEPQLSYIESYYMKIYCELTRSRQSTMSVGNIPISEIQSYCEMFGITDYGERSEIVYLVGQLDDELVSYYSKETK